jgi:hypothetical protein
MCSASAKQATPARRRKEAGRDAAGWSGGRGGRRADVLDGQRWIAGDDLFGAQPGGEIVEHHGDCNPRALDAGLAVTDGGVDAGALSRHSMAAVSVEVTTMVTFVARERAVEHLAAAGAAHVLLACTELAIALATAPHPA